jgi:hypothetical protein
MDVSSVVHRARHAELQQMQRKKPLHLLHSLQRRTSVIPEPNFPANPDEFVGRKPQLEAFRRALQQGRQTGRTPSFAVLGDWGIGKSSLLLKCSVICAETQYNMLPVQFSVSKELADYRNFAEGLLDTFSESLAHSRSATVRIQRELKNWKMSRVSIGAFTVDRDSPQFFLSSGSTVLRHVLSDAWRRFIRPAGFNGVIFFLDDLHNLASPSAEAIALSVRDQFQSLAVDGINCSVCFSAPLSYFSNIRSFAEPAVRFYDKVYLEPFTQPETTEYVAAVFGGNAANIEGFSEWLHAKTHGHPYFMAFICRQIAELAHGSLAHDVTVHHWPSIFARLENEKFRSDLAQVPEREIQLLRNLALSPDDQIIVKGLTAGDRAYFSRLTERGLLTRTARGRYKLYHPLFREFLKQEM